MNPILISGAGLSGLLFARYLRSHGIPFQLYERDANMAVRGQGYRIRLSSDGLEALKSVLTADEMKELLAGTSQTGGGGMHALDALTGEAKSSGKVAVDQFRDRPKLGGDVVGIARGFLRQELMKGLESDIHWGKQIVGYANSQGIQGGTEDNQDGVQAIFADGTISVVGTMLVGADGVHSKISRQLTDGKIRAYDTGARMIHGQSPVASFERLGQGVWMISDSRLTLIANVPPSSLNDPKIELGWVLVGAPGTFDAPGGNFSVVGKIAADLSRQLTSEWNSRIRPVFENQNDEEAAFLKITTSAPEGVPAWDHDPRVTILGDAAHAMTPAGGVGANTALKDAVTLGDLIISRQGSSTGVTRAYEEAMKVYASENVRMSFEEAVKRFNISELK